MLARAYESQENKLYAVHFYKEALRYNGASYEAFNRLVANHLLTREEKRALFEEGGPLQRSLDGSRQEDLWLKDYYMSRIEQAIRPSSEAEGYMLVRNNQQPLNSTSMILANNGSRSGAPFHEGDSSGIMSSPSRFQHDLLLEHIDNDEHDDTMRLRNP